MQILFVHQNFPGQYKHLAPALATRGHRVEALCINAPPPVAGVTVHRYRVTRGSTQNIHPWAVDIETKVLRGEACALAAQSLKDGGFMPDVICAHPGWGEALFLREIWPQARQLHFVEFHYAPEGLDVGFDPEFDYTDFAGRCRIRMKNANSLLNLDVMDHGVSPTAWQRSTVPAWHRDRISVIHDGIDTQRVRPDATARLEFVGEDGVSRNFSVDDEVVTFVNRNLEPSRGYHIFMRTLPGLLAARPRLNVAIVGGSGVSYGAKPAEGSYKDRYLAEVAERTDLSRVHFLGRIPYEKYLHMLQISAAHVYLTYPFVLSWSMLEAMSAGCLVIGSRTPPVEEVLRDGENGLLVDFFSPPQIAAAVERVLEHPDRMQTIRAQARQDIIANYDLQTCCLPRQIALVENGADQQGSP